MNNQLLKDFFEWVMEQPFRLYENGLYGNDDMEGGYLTIDNIIAMFTAEQNQKSTVFSRRECVWQYCPSPALCKEKCVNS